MIRAQAAQAAGVATADGWHEAAEPRAAIDTGRLLEVGRMAIANRAPGSGIGVGPAEAGIRR